MLFCSGPLRTLSSSKDSLTCRITADTKAPHAQLGSHALPLQKKGGTARAPGVLFGLYKCNGYLCKLFPLESTQMRQAQTLQSNCRRKCTQHHNSEVAAIKVQYQKKLSSMLLWHIINQLFISQNVVFPNAIKPRRSGDELGKYTSMHVMCVHTCTTCTYGQLSVLHVHDV